jgi:hypothetical protein
MKGHYLIVPLAFLVTTLFVSCSDGNDNEGFIETQEAPTTYFGIIRSMKGGEIKRGTRNTVDSISTWKDMISRRLSISWGSNVYDNFYVSETGNIRASMGPYIFSTTAPMINAISWYPYTSKANGMLTKFCVQENQSTFAGIEKSDLLVGVQQPGSSKIIYDHYMSQVEIHINLNRYEVIGNKIVKIPTKIKRVRLANTLIGGYVNNVASVATMALTFDSVPDYDNDHKPDTIDAHHYAKCDYYTTKDTFYSYRAILFPHTTSIGLIVEVHDDIYGDTIYEGPVEYWKYEPGLYYNIFVTLTDQLNDYAKPIHNGLKGEATRREPSLAIRIEKKERETE